jgi:hypothetical protein
MRRVYTLDWVERLTSRSETQHFDRSVDRDLSGADRSTRNAHDYEARKVHGNYRIMWIVWFFNIAQGDSPLVIGPRSLQATGQVFAWLIRQVF